MVSEDLDINRKHEVATTKKPLVSIITVVYNGSKYLEQAIQSVLNQTYRNIEYIIIDGASIDGTIDIIRRYDKQLAYWVSEPDDGIFHAMNKGINLATGEIIGLLNSDDFYFPKAVELVVESSCISGSCIWYGKQMRFEDYKDFCHFSIQDPVIEKMFERPSIFHPACFVHRDVYKKIGLFDQKYKVIADYDFLLRAIKNGVNFTCLNSVLTGFRAGGVSGTTLAWKESYSLIKDHPQHLASKGYIRTNIIKKTVINSMFNICFMKRLRYLKKKKRY